MRGLFSKQGQSLMYSATQRHPNFNPTPIPPPALRRLNGYMAFPGFLYCLNEADLISNFPLNMQRAIFTLKITNLYLTYFLLFFFELKCTEFFVITTI